MALVLVSGVVMVLTHNERLDEHIHPRVESKLRKRDSVYILFLAAGGAALVYYKTQDLGTVAIIISVLTAIIIILLSILVLIEKD